ncbi:MAG: WhiB family transcriptional regulator, partial [Myxococcaceae bacterium]
MCKNPITAQADFFPENRRSPGAKLAKQFCGVCPVRAQCLDWALEINEPWGIYGGTDPLERRWLKHPVLEDTDV